MKQLLLFFATTMLIVSCATTKRISNKGVEQEITTHCDPSQYPSTKEYYRSSNIGHSADISIARSIAMNKAKAKLAGDIKTAITASEDIVTEQERDNNNNDFAEAFTQMMDFEIAASLEEIETICSKLTKNSRTDEYTAYVTIQVPRNKLMTKVRERMKNITKK